MLLLRRLRWAWWAFKACGTNAQADRYPVDEDLINVCCDNCGLVKPVGLVCLRCGHE